MDRQGGIKPGAQFTGRWLWHRSKRSAIVEVNTVDPATALRLTYKIGEALMQDVIHLQSMGKRWCFICPACRRRARKLYLAPASRFFRCRVCSDLTYRSCQSRRKPSETDPWPILAALVRRSGGV